MGVTMGVRTRAFAIDREGTIDLSQTLASVYEFSAALWSLTEEYDPCSELVRCDLVSSVVSSHLFT